MGTIGGGTIGGGAAEGTDAFTPTVEEVAAYMRARLKGEFGRVETFNEETTPTREQIEELIPQAVRKVATRIGGSICECDEQEDLYIDARGLAALRTAMIAERSFFPEQVGSGRSPYPQMEDEWKEGIKVLVEAIAEHCGGGGGEAVGGEGAMPSGSFPCPSGIGTQDW